LAQLNHPNVASIHGVEESEGHYAVVMELADGPTLASRIAAGPLTADEALPIAKQIAEAIEEAHERRIVHRDLKPANVKVDREGRVKVLDFGLAKALFGDVGPEEATVAAPTETGIVMGTAAYMSPEQARGERVDARSDVWSFGVMLFEMLAGKRPFGGETTSDTLAAVLKEEPDWAALSANLPGVLTDLLRRCLRRTASSGCSRSETPELRSRKPRRRARAPESQGWRCLASPAVPGVCGRRDCGR
jgi:serine/threonine-protein kinase